MAGTFVDRVERFYQQRIEKLSRKTRTVIALFVIYGLLLVSPFITFYHTNIYGLAQLDASTVLALAELTSSGSVFDIPMETVIDTLETHPLIEDAYWSYGMDGLSLVVSERRVVAFYCEDTCETQIGRYYAKGFAAGYVEYQEEGITYDVPNVHLGVWNDQLAASLHALTSDQLASISDIYSALDTVSFDLDIRIQLQGSDSMIYVSLGDLPSLMAKNLEILNYLAELSAPTNLICGVSPTRQLSCVETSFTN